jgi:hypothetical protein
VSASRTGWRFGEGAETGTRAAPKPRTGITDAGYNGPWSSAKIFADGAYTPAGNHRHGYPPPSECHGGLIRTGLAACVTYLVREAAMAVATDGIGVETVIQGGGDTRVVAVNIDHVRSRAAPGEVHRLLPPHLVATRSERDLARCGCRRRRWSHSRDGGCRRS